MRFFIACTLPTILSVLRLSFGAAERTQPWQALIRRAETDETEEVISTIKVCGVTIHLAPPNAPPVVIDGWRGLNLHPCGDFSGFHPRNVSPTFDSNWVSQTLTRSKQFDLPSCDPVSHGLTIGTPLKNQDCSEQRLVPLVRHGSAEYHGRFFVFKGGLN